MLLNQWYHFESLMPYVKKHKMSIFDQNIKLQMNEQHLIQVNQNM